VLCLSSARRVQEFGDNIDNILNNGLTWLKEHSSYWSVENLGAAGAKSIYEISIGVRCFYGVGENFPILDKCILELYRSQNDDGGWDASVWSVRRKGETAVYSEVGATSLALEALALHCQSPWVHKYRSSIVWGDNHGIRDYANYFLRGVRWLIDKQSTDGSWNNKSCTPQSGGKIEGDPSLTKTCDALRGILASRSLLPRPPLTETSDIKERDDVEAAIDKAIMWVLSQERPFFDKESDISGWGWSPETIGGIRTPRLENTCSTLETLVRFRRVSLPLLSADALYLIKYQFQEDGNIEDGTWGWSGDTARITLSLIEFYRQLTMRQQ
jgi:hypothetical protein